MFVVECRGKRGHVLPEQGPEKPWTSGVAWVARALLRSRGARVRPGSRAPLDSPRWPGSPGHLSSRGRMGPWDTVSRIPDQGPEHARAGRVARDIQAVGAGWAPGVPDQGPEHPWTARAGRVARDISAVGAGWAPGVPDQGPEHPWTARAGRVARDISAVGAGWAPGVPDQGPEHPWPARAGRVARDISAVGAGWVPGVPDQGPEPVTPARAALGFGPSQSWASGTTARLAIPCVLATALREGGRARRGRRGRAASEQAAQGVVSRSGLALAGRVVTVCGATLPTPALPRCSHANVLSLVQASLLSHVCQVLGPGQRTRACWPGTS